MRDMAPETTTEFREAPRSIDCEQALLGAILVHNEAFGRVAKFLGPEHFFDPLHQRIFEAMRQLIQAGRKADPITLQPAFANERVNAETTVRQYLGKLAANATTVINAESYGRTLYDLAQRRGLIVVCEEAWAEAHNGSVASPAPLIETALQRLDALREESRAALRTEWDAGGMFDAMLETIQADNTGHRITTGWQPLDYQLGGGLWRGKYHILAGRTSMGKSMVAVSIGTNAARAGHGVLVLSMEMDKSEWSARMAADATHATGRPIAYVGALAGRLPAAELERFAHAAQPLRRLPFILRDETGLSIAEITMRVRKAAQTFERQGQRLGLVIIDHLGKVKSSDRYRGNRVHEMGEISKAVQDLAKSEQVAVLALHQLNRAVEGRENKRPDMSDLRDTGNLEEDADVVMLAYRPAYYWQKKEDDPNKEAERLQVLEACKNSLEILVRKNRKGATGTVELYCDVATNYIRAMAKGVELTQFHNLARGY